MSYAEMFLMTWAILSTVFATWVHGRAKFYYKQHKRTAVLVAELAFGDIKPRDTDDGYVVVENDEMLLKFKRIKE
jgi:hypothetical protein